MTVLLAIMTFALLIALDYLVGFGGGGDDRRPPASAGPGKGR